jgi:glycerate-2-kinase
MWETNDAGSFDRVVEGAKPLNDALDSEAGKKARETVTDSAAIDNVQILFSDLLAGGLELVFGWLTHD